MIKRTYNKGFKLKFYLINEKEFNNLLQNYYIEMKGEIRK